MTRDELDEILHQCYSVEIFPEEAAELIWGQLFDGVTEKIDAKDHATTKLRLKMANNAIKIAVDAFETINMWEEGECGATDMNECLKDFLPSLDNITKGARANKPSKDSKK